MEKVITYYVVFAATDHDVERYMTFCKKETAVACAKRLRRENKGTIFVAEETRKVVYIA